MEYPGFQMGSGGMLPFPGANPMMMAMQNAAFQVGVRACHVKFQTHHSRSCYAVKEGSCNSMHS